MICYDIMNMMLMCDMVNFYFIMIYNATSDRLMEVSYTDMVNWMKKIKRISDKHEIASRRHGFNLVFYMYLSLN